MVVVLLAACSFLLCLIAFEHLPRGSTVLAVVPLLAGGATGMAAVDSRLLGFASLHVPRSAVSLVGFSSVSSWRELGFARLLPLHSALAGEADVGQALVLKPKMK